MKCFILFFILLWTSNSNAQAKLLDCAVKLDTSSTETSIEIHIFSDPRCGFCRRAITDIGAWAKGKPIKIIALDLSGKPESVKKLDYYLEYGVEVRDASQCDEKFKNFIPKIYVKETKTNSQVMKLRGWHTSDLSKLKRKLNRHI